VSLVVLLILAVVWAVFLVPQVLRARAEKPADSIGAFRNQLSVLQRATPALGPAARPVASFHRPAPLYHSMVARSTREQVRRRRQNILVGLLGAMAFTFLLGLVLRQVLLLHVLVDGLFVAYCALLVRARNVGAERELKVRYLPGPVLATAEPTLLLRHSGS